MFRQLRKFVHFLELFTVYNLSDFLRGQLERVRKVRKVFYLWVVENGKRALYKD